MAAVPTVTSAQLQAVADPQVKAILRAMIDANAVRSGDIGNGDQAFLTREDLMDGGAKARAIAMALARPIAAAVSDPYNTDLTPLAQALEQRILASAAWQSMFTRLDLISAPDSLPGSMANLLLAEAKARGAAVTVVTSAVQKTNESLASTKLTLTTAIGNNAAAILEEKSARTTATDAIAQAQSIFIAATNKNVAGLQNDIVVKTNSDNALAQALNTLWTRIGANTALVQTGTQIVANNVGSVVTKFEQLQAVTTDPTTGLVAKYAVMRSEYNVINDKVSGMAAKWSVKLDLNGYISGLSLNAGVTPDGKSESMFIIAADVFAIGAPGKPNSVPFAFDAQTGLLALKGSMIATGSIQATALKARSITAESGVIGDLAVTNANIANAAITSAKIGDAEIGTLKIGGNAVTAMWSASGYASCSVNVMAMGVPMVIWVSAKGFYSAHGSGGWGQILIRVKRDGNVIYECFTPGFQEAGMALHLCTTGSVVDYPSGSVTNPAYHSYEFSIQMADAGEVLYQGTPNGINIAMMETRR